MNYKKLGWGKRVYTSRSLMIRLKTYCAHSTILVLMGPPEKRSTETLPRPAY